jgi:hypothetical protein
MATIKRISIVIAFLFFSFSSMAWWGLTGHRVVAQIAEGYLNPKARAAILSILGNETLAMASNWADFIKSDSNNSYLGPWHYLNVNGGLSKEEFQNWLKADTAVDAYTKINFLVAQLKNRHLHIDKKKFYLRLLIHIVGDIHQPLHVGHADDQGGNKIKITWFSEASNLHSVWDDKLIDMQKLSYTEYTRAINHVSGKQLIDWQRQPLSDWLFESYEIAGNLYTEITQPDQKLGYRYNYDHLGTLNIQLLKGGIRLAGLLNRIFA